MGPVGVVSIEADTGHQDKDEDKDEHEDLEVVVELVAEAG